MQASRLLRSKYRHSHFANEETEAEEFGGRSPHPAAGLDAQPTSRTEESLNGTASTRIKKDTYLINNSSLKNSVQGE